MIFVLSVLCTSSSGCSDSGSFNLTTDRSPSASSVSSSDEAQDLLDKSKKFREGVGVEKNLPESFRLCELAAQTGLAKAQHTLGWMYAEGIGTAKNYEKAVEWFQKSAIQGSAGSQNSLGNHYSAGWGINQDEAEAAKWYRLAADQDYGTGQYNLGVMYQHGYGVDQ